MTRDEPTISDWWSSFRVASPSKSAILPISRARVGSFTHPNHQKQKYPTRGHFCFLAEGVGFEPTVRINRTLDFESSPFDHSGIPPRAIIAGIAHRASVVRYFPAESP